VSIAHIINEYEEQNQKTSDRPKRETVWSEAVIFVAHVPSENVERLTPGADLKPHAGCLMVGVKKSDHRDFPMYRIAIGTILGDGRFVPGVSPRADLDQLRLGSVVWNGTFEGLTRLLHAAEEWINTDQGFNVDRFISRKGGEGRDRDAKAVKHTGKTERERAKGKAKPARVS
jgi:hypothetical protein